MTGARVLCVAGVAAAVLIPAAHDAPAPRHASSPSR